MILLIDNYDSFTYNLVHYLQECGAEVSVVRNDLHTPEEILAFPHLRGIVLSPGPCTPNEAGVCLPLLRKGAALVPMLGVCLGHQSLAQAFGGNVIRAPEPVHGKVAEIYHEEQGLFRAIPSPFRATRYHSLIVERSSLPSCLQVTAETRDGLIMGLQHEAYPLFGVQFHPESIASEHGHRLLSNFLEATR